jgi:hypothetical protein
MRYFINSSHDRLQQTAYCTPNSSILRPSASHAITHLGRLPRPVQVKSHCCGWRYFTGGERRFRPWGAVSQAPAIVVMATKLVSAQ